MVFDLGLKHAYIYFGSLRQHSFKFSVLLTGMVKEMEAFSKTKIKGVWKNSNFGGKTSMHKST